MKKRSFLETTNPSVYEKTIKRWRADNGEINCDKCDYHHNPHYRGTGRLASENTSGKHHKRYVSKPKRSF